jgi:hypothetical protein
VTVAPSMIQVIPASSPQESTRDQLILIDFAHDVEFYAQIVAPDRPAVAFNVETWRTLLAGLQSGY